MGEVSFKPGALPNPPSGLADHGHATTNNPSGPLGNRPHGDGPPGLLRDGAANLPPGQARRAGSALAAELTTQGQQIANKIRGEHQQQSNAALGPPATARTTNPFGAESRGQAYGHDAHGQGHDSALTSPALSYLRGATDGGALPQDVRGALDTLTVVLGRDALNEVLAQRSDKVEKLFDHLLRQVERTTGQTAQTARDTNRTAQQLADELVNTVHLERYLAQLEKTAGEPARNAAEVVLRLLSGQAQGEGEAGGKRFLFDAPELLRDLRAGAFLPTQEAYSPFPLTGRARVVSEMIELLHTLEALEHAVQQQGQEQGGRGGAGLGDRAASFGAGELVELLSLLPTLPGRAGREEMVRVLAALTGPLVDADGRTLAAKDSAALKLDRLLWLNTTGGLLGATFKSAAFPTHLSPLMLYGFDALYSLVGFDGRTLVPPHFAAVQAQINGSELDWVFGQPPLTEGWMRALIERLKDAALADQNLLGEMLETALLDGRFHAVLVQGSVAEGEAVSGSFSVKRLLPAPATFNPALAPA